MVATEVTCQVFKCTLQLRESIEASRKVADGSLCVAHVQLLKRNETRKLSKNRTTTSVFSLFFVIMEAMKVHVRPVEVFIT